MDLDHSECGQASSPLCPTGEHEAAATFVIETDYPTAMAQGPFPNSSERRAYWELHMYGTKNWRTKSRDVDSSGVLRLRFVYAPHYRGEDATSDR